MPRKCSCNVGDIANKLRGSFSRAQIDSLGCKAIERLSVVYPSPQMDHEDDEWPEDSEEKLPLDNVRIKKNLKR